MQFVAVFLFAIISSYSLVLAAPVNQTNAETLQAKQQKATEIAARLLKQMAQEKSVPQHQNEIVNKDKSSEEQDEDEIIDFPSAAYLKNYFDDRYQPIVDDLDKYFQDQYEPVFDIEEDPAVENENEIDEDDQNVFPSPFHFFDQQNWSDQDESDENVKPVVHSPVLDDSVMNAAEHQKQQQRRRRRSLN